MLGIGVVVLIIKDFENEFFDLLVCVVLRSLIL